jgi:hypothetical protein
MSETWKLNIFKLGLNGSCFVPTQLTEAHLPADEQRDAILLPTNVAGRSTGLLHDSIPWMIGDLRRGSGFLVPDRL